MAKVKVVNTGLDQNLNGTNFNNTSSQTIFSFGSFSVTTNFDKRTEIDYTNTLSSFVRAVTLETMGVTDSQSEIIHTYSTNAVLNFDKSDLNTFIRFGSAYEFLRVSIENIITGYPGSLFMSSQVSRNGNVTFFDYTYDLVSDTCTFSIPINCINNTFNLVYNYGNTSTPDDVELKNLNLSYDKYIIWVPENQTNNSCTILEYTGNTSGRNYLMIKAAGNPFSMVITTSAPINFHIKPNNFIFEEYRSQLNEYEKYIISTRDGLRGFKFSLKDPLLLDDGNITYNNTELLWSTGDKYNIEISTPVYQRFLEIILTIGSKYDKIKTDLIARFLTPTSLKLYDLTDEGKMTKLLRIYGKEFDQLREFIDSLVYINKVTYSKTNNIPDQLIKNLSTTFGWEYFSLVNENELVDTFLTIDENERNLKTDLLPAEIDIELWRRILINTNYFWKSKGTRDAIKSIFLLIGIPEPFINITEYVYTVEGKIDPRNVELTELDFPTNSFPYDTDGYPVAPTETNDFYFQTSGNTDSGQRYLDVFRMAGFNLTRVVDNKKSWMQSGATNRIDESTSQYYQEDSRLVINTKEVDVALDTARGIEYDVYNYIQTDFAANSSGYTLPFSYINISLGVSTSQTTFTLPFTVDEIEGDFEVRYNGILLNAPKTGTTTELTEADYSVSGNTFTLLTSTAYNSGNRRDVIQATFVYSGGTHSVSGITVEYVVTRIKANASGTIIPLPSYPRGDVQVTINGISLTKGTPQFTADYIVDPNNTSGSSQIIIQNSELIAYLQSNPNIQVAYVNVVGSDDISARSEVIRVDSFTGSKIYYNQLAGKYVYKLNYKANNASDLKVLIDGIALEPNMDYTVNVLNQYEIFLPTGIRYGTIITVYYLVGSNELFTPIVANTFGVGDISELSFLEFIELIQRKMINAKNRKTITDFKGGWYPSLLKIYVEYLKRATLASDNPLLSNGYTFENLYSFLSKYNSFFQRFVDQLLPATIILRKSGLLIRNSIFTKQKFMYRRGVNVQNTDSESITPVDMRGNEMLQYLGDDGSVFLIVQDMTPPPPPPPTLYVETVKGVLGSINTGGRNIIGYSLLTEYGIQYIKKLSPTLPVWSEVLTEGSLLNNSFETIITDVEYETAYLYRAFVRSGIYGYTGDTLEITTQAEPVVPSVETVSGIPDVDSIDNTGGMNIVGYDSVDYYGMQYRPIGSSDADIELSPTSLKVAPSASTQTIVISGDSWNTYSTYMSSELAIPWIAIETPKTLSLTGTSTTISISANTGADRSTTVCYIPSIGTAKCVDICQSSGLVIPKIVYMQCCAGGVSTPTEILVCGGIVTSGMSSGECYALTLSWNTSHSKSTSPVCNCLDVYCNSVSIYSCRYCSCSASSHSGTYGPILVKYGDDIGLDALATKVASFGLATPTVSQISISTITNGVGSFEIADSLSYMTCLRAEI